MTNLWGRGVAKILGMDICVKGNLKHPQSGYFIVSNHLSYLDIFAEATLFPVRYTPKSDIFWWPVAGWLVAISRPIWIKRQSRQFAKVANKKFKDTIEWGVSLIVYPEGTSSNGLAGILPFKSSVFEIPCAENLPVLPILISYPSMKRDEVCWYGDMLFFPHFWNVLGMKKINVLIYLFDPIYPSGLSRKEFSEKLNKMMNEKFKELYF
ncbi:MAG TPA: lysophospholipid acyltransferase family protein [Victivallales bacterium]|nr:lysophospholipid acyltransferase family protein [Victivallales bacterium]HRU01369.1 lysophospholipid acyltransferase family protein [Victivallales bacterium]